MRVLLGVSVALVLLGPAPQSAVLAETPFSTRAIFALPAHKAIDDRCQDARKFADRAAVADPAVDDIGAADAFAGANAFMKCLKLPRLNPDEDAQRYLFLAAATCLYMAGAKLVGADAEPLFAQSAGMARQLGGAGPLRSGAVEHAAQNYDANGTNNQPLNPAHESYEVERTPSGNAHAGAFSNEANELLAAIAGFASPPHAPQSAPPQPK